MFVNALKQAAQYTFPVTISAITHADAVNTGCGAYLLINRDGWILTAAHLFESNNVAQSHQQAFAVYQNQRQAIEQDMSIPIARKNKLIRKLAFDRNWIKTYSYWWAQDGASFVDAKLNHLADLAVARLANFKLNPNQQFPKFGDPSKRLDQGHPLCKLGFPFHEIKSTFDPVKNAFVFEPGSLPIPRFPLDGILTRYAHMQDPNTKAEALFIEMSTPGLRGQSGGPVFDTDGVVWGIQSQTRHLPLGFQPTVETGGKKTLEHQFLNVGLAAYVSEIISLFNAAGVKYDAA